MAERESFEASMLVLHDDSVPFSYRLLEPNYTDTMKSNFVVELRGRFRALFFSEVMASICQQNGYLMMQSEAPVQKREVIRLCGAKAECPELEVSWIFQNQEHSFREPVQCSLYS